MAKVKKPLETAAETYDCALRLLSLRDHSQKELRDKLAQRGAVKDYIENSIAKLTEYGIMNEERYAQRLFEAWMAKGIYGRQHLVAELRKRGVPGELYARILEQFTEALEQQHAERAAIQFCKLNHKKIEQGSQSNDPKARQRLYAAAGRYMAAKGFGGGYMEVILEAMQAEACVEE